LIGGERVERGEERSLGERGTIMMRERLELLLQLQEQDRRIRELEGRLRRLRGEKESLEGEIAAQRAELEQKREALEELRRESHRRNDEVDSLDYQIRKYQKELDEGIISYKEMEVLREKIAHSKARMEELEDEAIALMNEIEAREEGFAAEEAELAAREEELRAEIRRVEEESAARRAELEEAQGRRAELATRVERHLLEQYERLLEDYGYADPIATAEDGSCSGCKMRLSQNTLERLREGRELVVCENCHRILYWD
jgi:hypothetical protein